jgi:hypothetical protein
MSEWVKPGWPMVNLQDLLKPVNDAAASVTGMGMGTGYGSVKSLMLKCFMQARQSLVFG